METPSPETSPVGPPSSLPARMANVIAAPSEVFDEIRDAPYRTSNWLVPVTLAAIVGLAFILLAFAQPAVRADLKQQQEDAFNRLVEAGKMTTAQVDAALQGMESMGPLIQVFQCVGAVVGTFAVAFLSGGLLWLVSRLILKVTVGYWKCMEIVGLGCVVTMLGTVLTLFVVMLKGSITANLSPAMLISGLRPNGPVYVALSALNPIYLWWVALLALGLAKLAGRRWGETAIWLFGLYFGFVLLGVALTRLQP